ncbi:mechanosensitive ion channel family protein [Acinetobacter qingfengensis]|uniref:Small-conductance mechanosensitive channel n=1 Tax=Acinetobacter qingfengensis TaxID=1262585 RepID=A0A1E7QWQ6_9GAMM|nr:mechanosensitive ion channel family protein [Acinetobacter qingfengensis]KAA8731336.1 mechanosensitive ion channel family protein [Acinetobacter qingfengensis]OEY91523.1 transporter [Acinetobacter qingfengensis]
MSDEKASLKEVTEQTSQFIQNAGQKTTETVIQQAHIYNDAYTTMNKMIDGFWERVPYIISGLIVFLIFWFLSKLFKAFITKALLKRSNTRQNLVMVLHRVGSTFILFFGFLIALVIIIPGFSPGQLISALGIGSVAIGFAFKDIFQNLLSGVLILLSEPFRIGDTILVNGLEGTVEDIQIRATFLRSADGRSIVIPNATVYTSAITVNTAYQQRRCEFVVGIGYDADIDQASAIVHEVLNDNLNVLTDPAFTVQVSTLADFSINLMIRWWVDTGATTTTESISEIQLAVKKAFDQKGISIPYPIQDLHISQPVSIQPETTLNK